MSAHVVLEKAVSPLAALFFFSLSSDTRGLSRARGATTGGDAEPSPSPNSEDGLTGILSRLPFIFLNNSPFLFLYTVAEALRRTGDWEAHTRAGSTRGSEKKDKSALLRCRRPASIASQQEARKPARRHSPNVYIKGRWQIAHQDQKIHVRT